MIEYIKGALTELTPALAVVETSGVGYALNISLNTLPFRARRMLNSMCMSHLSLVAGMTRLPFMASIASRKGTSTVSLSPSAEWELTQRG